MTGDRDVTSKRPSRFIFLKKKTDFYPVSPNPLFLGPLYITEMMRSEETGSAQMLIN